MLPLLFAEFRPATVDLRVCGEDRARTGIGGRTLDLAFFLGEQNGRFAFRVPLFRDMIRRLEPERSLPRLVRKVQQG